jgi:hypothetical protein
MPTPLPRRDRMGAHVASSPLDGGLPWKTDRSAPASCDFRGLLSVHSRFGLHVRWITRSDPLHQRLRWICYLLHRSDCCRLERPVAGWDSHPLDVAAFARRTVFGHDRIAVGFSNSTSSLAQFACHATPTAWQTRAVGIPPTIGSAQPSAWRCSPACPFE